MIAAAGGRRRRPGVRRGARPARASSTCTCTSCPSRVHGQGLGLLRRRPRRTTAWPGRSTTARRRPSGSPRWTSSACATFAAAGLPAQARHGPLAHRVGHRVRGAHARAPCRPRRSSPSRTSAEYLGAAVDGGRAGGEGARPGRRVRPARPAAAPGVGAARRGGRARDRALRQRPAARRAHRPRRRSPRCSRPTRACRWCSPTPGMPEFGAALDLVAPLRARPPRHDDGRHRRSACRYAPLPPDWPARLADVADRVVLGTDFPNIPYPYAEQLRAIAGWAAADDRLGDAVPALGAARRPRPLARQRPDSARQRGVGRRPHPRSHGDPHQRARHHHGDLGAPRRRGVPVRRPDGAGPRQRPAGGVRDRHPRRARHRRPGGLAAGAARRRTHPGARATAWPSSASPSTTGWATATAAAPAARPAHRGRAARRAARARSRPDTVLTFGPDGVTGHPDHRTVSAWTGAAFAAAAPGARLLHAAVPAGRVRRGGRGCTSFDVYAAGLPRAHAGRPHRAATSCWTTPWPPARSAALAAQATPDRRPGRDARRRPPTPRGSARSAFVERPAARPASRRGTARRVRPAGEVCQAPESARPLRCPRRRAISARACRRRPRASGAAPAAVAVRRRRRVGGGVGGRVDQRGRLRVADARAAGRRGCAAPSTGGSSCRPARSSPRSRR